MKRQKWLGIIIFLMLTALLLSSCAPLFEALGDVNKFKEAANESRNRIAGFGEGRVQTTAAAVPAVKDEDAPPPPNQPAPKKSILRKQIYTATINLEVAKVDEALAKIKTAAEAAKGYVVNSNAQKSGDGKSGYIAVKIPPVSLDSFREIIKKFGNVVSDSLEGRDITEEYYDLQTRIKNAQVLEKRLLDLTRKSGRVEDLLAVERELGRVRENIESLQGRIKYYDQLVEMATVNIYLFEPSSAVPEKRGVVYMLKNAVLGGITLFALSIAGLIALVIIFVPWGAAVYFGYKIYKKYNKKK
jgi:hypothetical protein